MATLGLQTVRFASLFAGVGGFDLAFERAGMTCVGQVEIDARCREVLATHWPHVPQFGDIYEVSGLDDLGSVDVLCGGFPCQDYSVAGKRGGLAGDRGALWWQFHRLIAECRPEWVVGENVPGLLSSNGGKDFGAIVGSLVELGYGVVWRVLDAQYFGVAQRRRRVFIVGHFGGIPRPEILAFAEGCAGDTPPRRETGQRVAALTANSLGGGGPDDNLAQAGHLIATGALTASLANGIGGFGGQDELEMAVASTGGPVRRLTPLECERLQGFPDNWTSGLSEECECGEPEWSGFHGLSDTHPFTPEGVAQSDTQRYRQMGNAVAVPVVEWIGKKLVAA